MEAMAKLINEAIDEKLRLIEFLREENRRLMQVNIEQINRIEELEARIEELEGEWQGNKTESEDDF